MTRLYPVSPWHEVHAHVIEKSWTRDCDQKSSNIWHYNSFAGCLDVLIPSCLAFSHSKMRESYDEHEPDIGVVFNRIATLHLLLACICRRTVIYARPFLLNKSIKPLLRSTVRCCFEQSFFDAEKPFLNCKLFVAVSGSLLSLFTCRIAMKPQWPC